MKLYDDVQESKQKTNQKTSHLVSPWNKASDGTLSRHISAPSLVAKPPRYITIAIASDAVCIDHSMDN